MGWLKSLFAKANCENVQEDRGDASAWMDARGFRLVCDYMNGGYVTGFDRNREYEFMREEWESPSVFKLADVNPAFNVAGLQFREIGH